MTFKCNNGVMVGAATVTCQLQGEEAMWSGPFPTCQGEHVDLNIKIIQTLIYNLNPVGGPVPTPHSSISSI